MRLLITRPEPEASHIAERLLSLGHEPLLQPLLSYRPHSFDTSILDEAGALLFSSGYSLRALEESGHAGRTAHLPVYCVGHETARKARALGHADIREIRETGTDLANSMTETAFAAAGCLVHIAGRHRAYDFEGHFARAGVPFRTIVAYEMSARRNFDDVVVEKFQNGMIDGITLFSPRTADVFVDLCIRHCLTEFMKYTDLYCLSEPVAFRTKCLPSRAVFVAEKPTLDALLSLIGTA